MPSPDEMNTYADEIRDLLIDDFATLSNLINERDYAGASVFMARLGNSLQTVSQAFALEALARRLEQLGLDRPEDI